FIETPLKERIVGPLALTKIVQERCRKRRGGNGPGDLLHSVEINLRGVSLHGDRHVLPASDGKCVGLYIIRCRAVPNPSPHLPARARRQEKILGGIVAEIKDALVVAAAFPVNPGRKR